MKQQLSIFNNQIEEPANELWELYVDGAARSNPGPAGAGVYLLRTGTPIEKRGFYLGSKTNNQAEYLALLLGLYFAKKLLDEKDKLTVISDSELLIKQLKGVYRVKDPHLKLLYQCAQGYLAQMHTTYLHVLREKNTIADQLANEGIDKKNKVPRPFIDFCKAYGIEEIP